MARYLVDTNLLLRLSDTPSPQNPIAARALARLFEEAHDVFITAQNLIEFWGVATRPQEANGLGWSVERTLAEISLIREKFPLLSDTPAILEEWTNLVKKFAITGKRTHDARLVAVMKTNGLDHLLTFNVQDFNSFSGLSIVDPRTMADTSE